jgi:ATP-dependent helicase/nuclease subunit B
MNDTLLILPTSAAVAAQASSRLGGEAILLGSDALTLKGLAEEICSASRTDRRSLSATGRTLLLRTILTDFAAGELAEIAAFPGFVAAAANFISGLRKGRVSPEELTVLVRRAGCGERLQELACLYARYRRELDRLSLFDPDDVEEEALRHLAAGGPLPSILEGRRQLRIDGVHDFSPLQAALLEELSKRLPVEVILPYDFDRSGLFAAAGKTAREFEALVNPEVRIELEFREPVSRFLLPLVSFLDSGIAPEAPAEGGSLFSAPGRYRECEEIGRRIRRMMEAGRDAAEIAVLVRDLKDYGPMLEDVCRRFRIPVSYRRGGPLRTSPLIATILAPFDIVGSRFAREEIVTLLKSTYGSFVPCDLHPDAVEEAILAAGYIDARSGSLEEALERRIAALRREGATPEREERVLGGMRGFLAELGRFTAPRTLVGFAELVEEFAARHGLYARALAADDLRALKRDVSAIAQLRQILAELKRDVALLGLDGERIAPEEFALLLVRAMEGKYLGGERTPGVSILNFHEARGLSFEELFVAGLTEGVMPPRHDPDPFLKEEEKRSLNRAGGRRLFSTLRERGAEEPLLFALALSSARGSLTLSYSSMDEGGSALLPSFLLEQAASALGLAEERVAIDAVIPEPEECLEEEEILNSLARAGCTDDILPGFHPLGEKLRRISTAGEIEERRTGGSADASAGRFRYDGVRADLLELFRSRESRFSPTSLEEYGSCPFAYFARRVLRLRPVEKPEGGLDPREEGSAVHEILFAFYKRIAAEGGLPLNGSEVEERVLRDEAARVFARYEEERRPEPLLWEAEKERIVEMLLRYVAAEGEEQDDFHPAAFEEDLPPLELAVGEETVFIPGKADRLDLDPASEGLRVVDYKTGRNEVEYASLLKRENMGRSSFQMPVYLLAAARRIEKETGKRPSRLSARYCVLRKTLRKDLTAEGDEWESFFSEDAGERRAAGDDNFLNRTESTIARILSGEFPPEPTDADKCRYCDFGTVCRFSGEAAPEEE